MKRYVSFYLLFIIGSLSYICAQVDVYKIKPSSLPKLSLPDSLRFNKYKPVIPTFQGEYNEYQRQLLAISNQKKSMQLDFSEKKTIFNSSYSRFIIPAALISYGVITHSNKSVRALDTSTNHEVSEHFLGRVHYDDYLQFAPAASVYGLDLMGIKAKHNFRDRTLIMATSYLVMGVTVQSVKSITKVERPDGSNLSSFPSGHTATAFVGAHILFKEYKDVSPWIGIGGYTIAAGVGGMRVLNKKHWISDVVTGAGVGILSAEIGYMMLPVWHRVLGIKEQNKSLVIMPMINTESAGIGISYTF